MQVSLSFNVLLCPGLSAILNSVVFQITANIMRETVSWGKGVCRPLLTKQL